MDSPYKQASDSPSKQLLLELGRLRIHAEEDLYARLERETDEREKAHKIALAAASVEHERVRRSAEAAAERFQLELEKERKKREDEERRELDKKRQEKIERELVDRRREIERARTAEVEERRAAEEGERRAAEARKAKLELEERLRLGRETVEAEAHRRREEVEHANKKAQEAATAAKKRTEAEAQQPQASVRTSQPSTTGTGLPSASQTPSTRPHVNPDREVDHQRYQAIHQRLKELRRFMISQGKSNPALKKRMGDMRREIKKCVGQLTEGKGANRGPINQIMKVLKEAITVPEPRIEIPQFLASPPPPTSISDSKGPALLIYLLNIFSKAIISQFIDEASVSPKTADPIGVVAVSVFAANEFRWQGHSLIDILLAKYHIVCPVLWGIYGDERTVHGKTRLGWWREDKDDPNAPWISAQRHSERMTGLGAGFAALALRNFEKSRLESPFPNVHYWQALAAIVNVPPNEVSQTHFIVLKAMIENYEARFLEFYGDAAKVALRKALVEFPRQASNGSVAASAVAVLPDVLRRDKKFTLVD
ncbi:hypothetical protein MMC16_003727 [Acarospora aff. strigata]|nr:hypothetical protein [Acarospora aff. strigata]